MKVPPNYSKLNRNFDITFTQTAFSGIKEKLFDGI